MIGLVLVTHGNLAKEFVSAMQHVVGPQEQVETVCIGPDGSCDCRGIHACVMICLIFIQHPFDTGFCQAHINREIRGYIPGAVFFTVFAWMEPSFQMLHIGNTSQYNRLEGFYSCILLSF